MKPARAMKLLALALAFSGALPCAMAQMGKDGKWQANFYDPDGTRVELMEFQPVMAPCCSAFTAESPAR